MTAPAIPPTIIPPAALPHWHELADALATIGPAPCEGDVLPPDAWWSADVDELDLAVAACRLCPVVPECLAYAIAADERYGLWGGLTAAERHVPDADERAA